MKATTRLHGLFFVILTFVSIEAHAAETADTIYLGGPILTINDKAPRAEAVAVADGLILAVGDRESVMTHKGAGTEIVDLEGRAMLPGFVDSHGHTVMGGLQALSGDILGPAQRVDVMTALKAMTIWPAWQHFEADSKGSIEEGKLADFVILSKDPTAVDPETLDTLKVLMTIKEGVVVFALD